MRQVARLPQKAITEAPLAEDALLKLNDTLTETNTHLAYLSDNTGKIATNMEGLKNFINKWLPWILAIIALVYPKLAQLIQTIPLPHN